MLTVEFLKRKNELIKKHTGLTLVPKAQLKEVECLDSLNTLSDTNACPYCMLYFTQPYCGDCPMVVAGNRCVANDSSTYAEITMKHPAITNHTQPWTEELEALIVEWNKDLEGGDSHE